MYFNHEVFSSDPKNAGIELLIATEMTVNYLQSVEGIAQVYLRAIIKQGMYNETGVKGMMVRGYNFKRSGDVLVQLEPSWIPSAYPTGTTHGSAYSYDTHVPILFLAKASKRKIFFLPCHYRHCTHAFRLAENQIPKWMYGATDYRDFGLTSNFERLISNF